MLQQWLRLSFLHWRYPPRELAATLPPGLEIDTYDGSAWLGLVPFRLQGWRPPGFPSLPWISWFPETNLRTYVRSQHGSGIWFYSLDAARVLAVAGARLAFGLPYMWARMTAQDEESRVTYRSQRTWPDRRTRSHIVLEHGRPVPKDDLAVFLTERYRLYSIIAGRLTYTPVEHLSWPLREASIVRLEQNITATAGFGIPRDPPLVYYSEGVEARIGMVRREP